ncbi:MAG: hypothetical protein RL329_3588 [Bacteroidota bacterium]|jgi:hypothetical protein
MKFVYFILLIYFLISCNVPTHAPKIVQQAQKVDTMGLQQTERIYDTSDLDIQVVHNPQVPRVYGIQLHGKGADWDKCCPVKIEKVVFGDLIKVYSDTCEREQREKYGSVIYDYCACIPTEETFFYSKFKLETDPQKPIRPNTKCVIYYTAKKIKKMNYVDTIHIIDCFIENTPGQEDLRRPKRCIWDIGVNQ